MQNYEAEIETAVEYCVMNRDGISRRGAKTCYECGRPFGLIRHRFTFKQFCSQKCLEKYRSVDNNNIAKRDRWLDFLRSDNHKRW